MLCIYILAVTRSQLRAANVSCSSFVSRSAAEKTSVFLIILMPLTHMHIGDVFNLGPILSFVSFTPMQQKRAAMN